MQYGCIGKKLGHSFSKEIHAHLSDYDYEIREVPEEELGAFLTEADFLGINVTIPYKQAVIPYLHEVHPVARAIGAVNTIVKRDGRLCGYNTDFFGLTALVRRIGVSLRGKKCAVLGTGGASRTALEVARAEGAHEVLWVSRTAKPGAITYEELAARHPDTEYVLQTTPLGMFPKPEGCPISVADFSLSGVADAVYNPLRPNLVLEAQAAGIPAEGGLFMLVAQAVEASEIFLGKQYPQGTTERVFALLLKEKENIVLTGMPGAGKSTVGLLLSGLTGRPFLDSDEEIVKRANKSIAEIFAEDGERVFRDLETEVIAELSQRSGVILSTGGGAILRDENVRALKRNGRLFFLDRPLEALLPTSDRPLASSREAIASRYRERYPRYQSTADIALSVTGTPEETAEAVLREFEALICH